MSPKSQTYVDPAGVELFVNDVGVPKHSTDDTNEGTGIGLTVITAVAEAVQDPIEPITVYVEVAPGFAVNVALVVDPTGLGPDQE